jgi:hypothetical protein
VKVRLFNGECLEISFNLQITVKELKVEIERLQGCTQFSQQLFFLQFETGGEPVQLADNEIIPSGSVLALYVEDAAGIVDCGESPASLDLWQCGKPGL